MVLISRFISWSRKSSLRPHGSARDHQLAPVRRGGARNRTISSSMSERATKRITSCATAEASSVTRAAAPATARASRARARLCPRRQPRDRRSRRAPASRAAARESGCEQLAFAPAHRIERLQSCHAEPCSTARHGRRLLIAASGPPPRGHSAPAAGAADRPACSAPVTTRAPGARRSPRRCRATNASSSSTTGVVPRRSLHATASLRRRPRVTRCCTHRPQALLGGGERLRQPQLQIEKPVVDRLDGRRRVTLSPSSVAAANPVIELIMIGYRLGLQATG